MKSSAAASAKGPTVLEPSNRTVPESPPEASVVSSADPEHADKSKSPAAASATGAMMFFFTLCFSYWNAW
jgi:hypothetical protein